jgi:RNA-directed DNA polymerase
MSGRKGSAGIDGLTIAAFTERQDELLARLHEQLRDRSYRPRAVKRVAIPKAGGGTRNLGIPSVADRVVQQALVQKMTPIFEPLFADCSFGYRPGRSPHMAMRKVWREINEGNLWILDADLRSYFDKIDQERLVGLIAEEISDGRVLRLIRSFLEAGVIVGGAWEPTKTGVPQGGVASPLWSNIYLTPFDHAMTKAGYRLTRWADDFVIVCRTRQEAEAALATARTFLHERLGVSLHPEKTRIVHITNGFEFLGYKIRKGKGLKLPAHKRTARTNRLNLYAVPRQKSVDRFKDQIRSLTRRNAPIYPASIRLRRRNGARTGKRLAGKLHEPFERAVRGRAYAPPLPTLQLGSRRTKPGNRPRSRWSKGRRPRGMRTSKARAGRRTGKVCHRRWSAYGKVA